MAKPSGITIRLETRVCTVDDKIGYFLCWEQYADVIAPGISIGSHSGGQYSRVFGIVEFENGVERVDPTAIKFMDEEHGNLCALSESFKKSKEVKNNHE